MEIKIIRSPFDVGKRRAVVIINKIALVIFLMLIFIVFGTGYDKLTNRIKPLRELNELIWASYDIDTGTGTGIISFLGWVFAAVLTYAVYKALKFYAKRYWGSYAIDRDKLIIFLEKEFRIISKIDSLIEEDKSKINLPSHNIRRSYDLLEVKDNIDYIIKLWENPYY